MFLNKGLWILIDLDGIGGAISQTYEGNALLTIFGPERTPGSKVSNQYHCLGPEGLPTNDDTSAFALLYRKVDSLVHSEKIKGPYGEDHPAVYARFRYIYRGPPAELAALLEEIGVFVKVRKVPHKGDDAKVEQAKQDFGRWIDASTEFDPNPKIEDARKREEERKKQKARMKQAEQWDQKFRCFVLFPSIFAILAVVLWGAFSLHWFVGITAILFTGFAWWWVGQ